MNHNWYIYIICVVVFTFVGLTTFDNIASALILGIGSGGIFGWVISSLFKKKT
ncbi:hypothetical protein [Alteribacter keqinensis]|uniref:hypothetical protein n=1 Tax=Alteribacter keqinensis TaxID=2483800 RepID=UPI0016064018|nr:hypothetical protein [Alteribacter keqinensis]